MTATLFPVTAPAPTHSAPAPLTMSSKEIAELTGKEHFNVMRDIRKMLEDLGQDALSFEGILGDAYGRPQPIFNLPKDLTTTLVSGYSTVLRHRIVTRWMELEEATTVKVPTSFREALLLAASQQEEIERLSVENQAMAPKVQVFDAVVAERHMSLSNFARTLTGVNVNKIKSDLLLCQYLWKKGTKYHVKSAFRDTLFIEKLCPTYGSLEIFPTEKGKKVVVELFRAGKLTLKKGRSS